MNKIIEELIPQLDGIVAKNPKSDWSKYQRKIVDMAIKALKQPSITSTLKEGKWINGDPICPCCGENKYKDLDADIWADWQPKYCPNCGARMESEDKIYDKRRN